MYITDHLPGQRTGFFLAYTWYFAGTCNFSPTKEWCFEEEQPKGIIKLQAKELIHVTLSSPVLQFCFLLKQVVFSNFPWLNTIYSLFKKKREKKNKISKYQTISLSLKIPLSLSHRYHFGECHFACLSMCLHTYSYVKTHILFFILDTLSLLLLTPHCTSI